MWQRFGRGEYCHLEFWRTLKQKERALGSKVVPEQEQSDEPDSSIGRVSSQR